MTIHIDASGHYYRDSKGAWRYAISGEEVPGARDRLLWESVPECARVEIEHVPYLRIPAHEVHWRPELVQFARTPGTWIEGALDGRGAMVETYYIPAHVLDAAGPDPECGMWAPELEPWKLAHADQVADFMGWMGGANSVRSMMCRGRVPRPAVRLRQSGRVNGLPRTYWTWPLLEQWRHRHESQYGRVIYDRRRERLQQG